MVSLNLRDESAAPPLRVVIIGGGFSGTLVAIHLLRQNSAVQIDLADPRLPGRGLAYSTVWDDHLLNVPAIRMSAFGSEPTHFLDWLHSNGKPQADAAYFAPRKLYGTYLQHVLETTVRTAGVRGCSFSHHLTDAVSLGHDGAAARVDLRNGAILRASKVVLACGNPPPRPLASPLPGYFASPWEAEALAHLDPDRDVLLIGAGLTAVDAFLALLSQGHRAKIHLLSRRGQVPQPHQPYHPLPHSFSPSGLLGARELLRAIRKQVRTAQAEGVDWRAVIDSMRPVTNDIWQQLDLRSQQRLLRHLKTWWDIHRHRMAPEIGAKVAAARAAGQLVVHAGRLIHLFPAASHLEAQITLRTQEPSRLEVQRVINCTGPDEDYRNTLNPLLRSLLASGFAAPNAIGKGLRTSEHGELIAAYGTTLDWLVTLGPLRLGGLFETTAVPELRKQAEALAGYLSSIIFEPVEIAPELFIAAGI